MSAAMLAALAMSASLPAHVAAYLSPDPPARPVLDLGDELAGNGLFRGSHLSGAVSVRGWSLVSDMSTGEAPRFAPTTAVPLASNSTSMWHDVGGGLIHSNVYALAVAGTDLYVGGTFSNVGGNLLADYLVKWNGSTWSAVGDSLNDGTGTNGAINGAVYSLTFVGGILYAGGHFTNVAGIPQADYVAKWDGSHWSALGDSLNSGAGPDGALNGTVYATAASGASLYVGGDFIAPAGLSTQHIAKWTGTAWAALGTNASDLNNSVFALAVSGTNLFVGGRFSDAGGNTKADAVARWDGSLWHELGDNLNGGGSANAVGGTVYALAVSSSDLYVGGDISDVAGIQQADYVAMWNGTTWSAVGQGPGGSNALTQGVRSLAMIGTKLYAGGLFTDAFGDSRADHAAQWDGNAWSALGDNLNGGGTDGALTDVVHAFAAIGSDVYVGGSFTDAAGVTTADYLARWNLPSTPKQPDGRIRKGTGAFVGNDVYNTTGLNQSRSGGTTPGHTIRFGISIQNDAAASDSFTVASTGTVVSGYSIKYFVGTTDVTSAIVAGSYNTGTLAVGGRLLITAKVTIKAAASPGSTVTRLVTLTSVQDPTKQDAVKFTATRK